jgi:hypothetical protein
LTSSSRAIVSSPSRSAARMAHALYHCEVIRLHMTDLPYSNRMIWSEEATDSNPAIEGSVIQVAQFIRICRWLQLIHKGRLAPLENAPFSTPWA